MQDIWILEIYAVYAGDVNCDRQLVMVVWDRLIAYDLSLPYSGGDSTRWRKRWRRLFNTKVEEVSC